MNPRTLTTRYSQNVTNLIYQKMAKSLNKAKEKYTRFERQNIQIHEDSKHLKTQMKKLSSGIEKVGLLRSFLTLKAEQQIHQKEKALEANAKEKKTSEERAKELVEPLANAEKLLDQMYEGIKGTQLLKVLFTF